jgi:catechol 2,3-dioxygenase-like lactoylglutathione lyase family enzyme
MPFKFHHIHLKSRDPEAAAAWYGRALGCTPVSSLVRPSGERFITCATADGTVIAISGQKTGQVLPEGSAEPRFGLEHFALETQDFDADLARVVALGAPLIEGPITMPNGIRYAFVEAPDHVRLELMFFPKG